MLPGSIPVGSFSPDGKHCPLLVLYSVPGDIRDAAFCAGVKTGNADDWHGMLDVYVNSASASDRQSAQLALACTNDSALLAKYNGRY